MQDASLIKKDIDGYLRRHYAKELLRFVTVGSVDDGKSTLIGRLLYDSGSVFDDQLAAIKKHKGSVADGEIDYSLLLDGLLAEREQGITIDVAYRYFSTDKRKFIIADTPGHVQYTRNMATGASNADLALILIDARLGILPQSKRHAYIASLLGIPHLVVCINKMDLVDYQEGVFNKIKEEFIPFLKTLGFESDSAIGRGDVAFLPVSALKGDNIVSSSPHTPWNKLGTLLNYLETVPLRKKNEAANFCLPVQSVLRPHLNFRGFAGTIAGGKVSVGDEVWVLPTGQKSRVKSIVDFGGELKSAQAPMAATLTLQDEIDISRGSMIVHEKNSIEVTRALSAMMVWMDATPLKKGHTYWVKHTTNLITGLVDEVEHVIDVETLAPVPANTMKLNDIARVRLSLSRPLMVDLYTHNRSAGAFILIDRITNATVACGMICGFDSVATKDAQTLALEVTRDERELRLSQKASVVAICGLPGSGKMILARALERELFRLGYLACVMDNERLPGLAPVGTKKELEKSWPAMQTVLNLGGLVLAAVTLPQKADQKWLREQSKSFAFVYMNTPIEVCRQRLSAMGRKESEAKIKFEPPVDADLTLNSQNWDLENVVKTIVELLKSKKIIF